MEQILKVFQDNFISENDLTIYKVYAEYEVWISLQKVGIKILIDSNGKFHEKLSHHYKGKDQFGPYTSSVTGPFPTEYDAIYAAKREIFSFYNQSDEDAVWVKSDYY